MLRKDLILFLFFGVTGVFIYSGCSASSSSIRYNSPKEKNVENDSSIRFTSEDNEKKINNSDTSFVDYNLDEDEQDDIPESEPSIDLSSVMNKINSSDYTDINAVHGTVKERMLMEIIKYLNTPYKFGGTTKDGIDCSSFTQTIFKNVLSMSLLRTAREQFTQGLEVGSKNDLQFGDLIFFNTRRRVRPGHVGIYIGENLFAHASSKQGVIISSLDHDYYSRKYMGGRRIDGLFGANQ